MTTLDDLTLEYQNWCKRNNRKIISADEQLLDPNNSPEQVEYLEQFIDGCLKLVGIL